MRDGWVETTLAHVAEVNPRVGGVDSEAPFITMSDVDEWGRWARTSGPRANRGGAKAIGGDVLVARITPCLENGKIAQVPHEWGPVGGSTEFLVVRAGAQVLPDYLYYWAQEPRTHLRSTRRMIGTSGRKRVSAGDYEQLAFLLPPIEEQRRIVDLMSHVDGDIETQVSEISATIRCWTGALRAAQPTKGAEHPLTRIFSFVIGGAWGSPPGEDETNVLALGTSAFAGDALTVDPGRGTERSLSVDRAQKRGIMRGDILLERSGGSPTQPVGRVIRALEDSQHVVPSDFQRLLRPDTELIDAGFAFWTLWMNYQDGVVLPYQKNTTSIRNLQVTEYLNNARIVIPDMSAQRDWVALAQQFEHLVDTQRVQLGRSRALRSSLLTALLSGEHAVPDSYDEFIRNEGAA